MKKLHSRRWYAAIAILVFLIAVKLHDMLNNFQFYRSLRHQSVYLASILLNTVQIGLISLALSLTHRIGPKRILKELGLWAPPGRAFTFAFLASLPMLIGFTLSTKPHLSILGLLTWTVIGPITEEVGFRGYLFRQLHRRAGWGFWPAALINSVLFALIHIYQAFLGEFNVWELVGILAVTGLGGLFFSWLFVRWQDNLWVPIAVHIFMNTWWEVFQIDKTALGGWLANGTRILTIFLAIVLTIYKDRIWKPLPIESQQVSDQNHERENHSYHRRLGLLHA
ncbi:MAG: CPBP family intramembrane metalloprotease [Acidobacteriota bacterium]|nr:CPBP family intramembrane metalloprotease [Acidobacteriota bacterium]